jgi:hypothetical protein
MATQTFEARGFRFVAGDKYTNETQKGREWIAEYRGDNCWLRAASAHMPLCATRAQIIERFDLKGLFQ